MLEKYESAIRLAYTVRGIYGAVYPKMLQAGGKREDGARLAPVALWEQGAWRARKKLFLAALREMNQTGTLAAAVAGLARRLERLGSEGARAKLKAIKALDTRTDPTLADVLDEARCRLSNALDDLVGGTAIEAARAGAKSYYAALQVPSVKAYGPAFKEFCNAITYYERHLAWAMEAAAGQTGVASPAAAPQFNETEQRICEGIIGNPGISGKDLAGKVGLKWEYLRHCLTKKSKLGKLGWGRRPGRSGYYPPDVKK